jgi:tRNA (cmo5U34)-methyltransferase
VQYRVCDLRDPAWPGQVGGPFDAVVSALAIHNLGEPAAIRRVFAEVAEHHHELPANIVVPTVEDHLSWLREAGFAEVDCVWKQFSEVFLCGFHS